MGQAWLAGGQGASSYSSCFGGVSSGEFQWPLEEQCNDRQQPNHSHASASGARSPTRRHRSEHHQDNGPGEEALPQHRRAHTKGPASRELIAGALRQNRLFMGLADWELDELVQAMEYYVFNAGDAVVKEGIVGSYFFVADTEGLETRLYGGPVGTIPRGRAFGELSLLQKVPRSVSVVATQANVGVWAADGWFFRSIVQASMVAQMARNRTFLDTPEMLRGLSPQQLDAVADVSTLKRFGPGERPTQLGREAAYIYFVKSGKLRVLPGVPERDANARGADCLLGPGSCLCERALLYGEPFCVTTEVVEPCELLRVNLGRLHQALGGSALSLTSLNQGMLISCLERSGLFPEPERFKPAEVARAMELQEYTPGAEIPRSTPFFVVMDGSVQVGAWPQAHVLRRGQWHGQPAPLGSLPNSLPTTPGTSTPVRRPTSVRSTPSPAQTGRGDAFSSSDLDAPPPPPPPRPPSPPQGFSAKPANVAPQDGQPSPSAALGRRTVLRAGHNGCRLAVLTNESAMLASGSEYTRALAEEIALAVDLSEIAHVISKVSVFMHLPKTELDRLARGATQQKYCQGETVVQQGDPGVHFFVVAEGELNALVTGRVVRKYVKCSYFGERALLFNEPRAATIRVVSPEAELLMIERDVFLNVIASKSHTQEELLYRVSLQDPGVELRDLRRLAAIGCGTSGVVHLVQHRDSGYKYALKQMEKVDGKIPPQVQHEIEVLAENDHPFIMHLVKAMESPKCVFLLTEYVRGGELHAAIRTISTVLSRWQAMFYAGSILLMLEDLSDRHIVYRDLKPENLMLDGQGYLKLIDFGSAKKLDKGAGRRTFTMVGTPHYMAPEVMRNKGYGTEVDIWALGVILYELMCGCLPFGDDLETTVDICKAVLQGHLEFWEGLDEAAQELITALLVTRPQQRLGCGERGYEEIKQSTFFNADELGIGGSMGRGPSPPSEARPEAEVAPKRGADFFALLIGRELQAPIPPSHVGSADRSSSKEQKGSQESESRAGGRAETGASDNGPCAGWGDIGEAVEIAMH